METINKIILCIWGGLFIAFGALASAGLPAPLNGIIFSTTKKDGECLGTELRTE